MGRRTIAAAALALAGVMLAAPAVAQFGSIFGGDSAPRPPQGVPGGRQQFPNAAPAPVQPPPPNYPPPANYPAPGSPYGGIESQTLAPPGGAAVEQSRTEPVAPSAALPRRPR